MTEDVVSLEDPLRTSGEANRMKILWRNLHLALTTGNPVSAFMHRRHLSMDSLTEQEKLKTIQISQLPRKCSHQRGI